MSKYFYVKAIQIDSHGGEITGITGYFTNQLHTMFLPPQTITNQDAIKMMDAGIILFTKNEHGQRKMLKKDEISRFAPGKLDSI